jgi:hypothetical protein
MVAGSLPLNVVPLFVSLARQLGRLLLCIYHKLLFRVILFCTDLN